MAPTKAWWIRKRLMDRYRGYMSFVSFPDTSGYRVHPVPVVADRERVKTRAMRKLEKDHWRSIEFLLLGDTPEEVATKLGITPDRVRNWLTYLQLKWTKEALPVCKDCKWYTALCNPKVDTIQYPLQCRILKLTRQPELHDLKVAEMKA